MRVFALPFCKKEAWQLTNCLNYHPLRVPRETSLQQAGKRVADRVWGIAELASGVKQTLLSALRSESAVRERLFDDHDEPGSVGSPQRVGRGPFEQVPGGLYGVEQIEFECSLYSFGLARAGDRLAGMNCTVRKG